MGRDRRLLVSMLPSIRREIIKHLINPAPSSLSNATKRETGLTSFTSSTHSTCVGV